MKPENIFLPQPEPVPFVELLDFGIAKLTEVPVDHAATQTGVVVGTPQYMSPEQLLRPKEADHRGDLWALAVVAYHALAGVPPFEGETLAALIVSITQAKFARVRTHRSELPPEADVWFDRALGLEREARFGSAAELAESLATAGELFAPRVDMGGAPASSADVLERLRKQLGFARERNSLHDVCAVRLTSFEGDPAWSADCHVVVRLDAKVGYVLRRYLYGGPEGKLRVVAEPKVFRMPSELRAEVVGDTPSP